MKIGDPEERARLKELAEKIKALLREYDVAALVNIQGKDQAEYINEITPTWSCFTWENDPDDEQHVMLRFKAKTKTGSEEEKERARLTCGMVLGFVDVLDKQSGQMAMVLRMLGSHLKIEHISREQDEP